MAHKAIITGIVLDENQRPLINVNISTNNQGTATDETGFYLLEITSDTEVTIRFTHLGHEDVVLENLILTTNETFVFNPVMKANSLQIDEVVVTPTGEKSIQGIITLSPETVKKIPGANAGIANVLKLLPGVSSNNELSTQYAVRGGNYDENLIYINGIEVYRPFLVRSGQQEGLGVVNSNMVSDLSFSAGGFQARYGDRLSSVLDITYKSPASFGLQLEASLLGASATIESRSKDKKFSQITGLRFRDNSLLVNSQQTQSNYNPSFIDMQSYLSYKFTEKFHLNFLGTVAINNYRNEPLSRQTNFGTLDQPLALVVFFQGNEQNKYSTVQGAVKADLFPSDSLQLNFTASAYHALEEEFSDVIAQYELGEIDTDLGSDTFGQVTSSRGIGTQFNRARNILDALVLKLGHQGKLSRENKELSWGLQYQFEDFRDQLNESEFLDSLGVFIRPPGSGITNNEPEEPFNGPILPFEGVNAQNNSQTHRVMTYGQFSNQSRWKDTEIYYNIGLRAQYWSSSGEGFRTTQQFILSPRLQFGLKPDWKRDMLFRLAAGLYQQPPFYRELRAPTGILQPEVRAQKSFHIILGNEYSFRLWNRPFNLSSEAYYKFLSDVNVYTLEDVRIRYAANNDAKAFAYGLDFRLNGAFVPGTESWLSLGFLRTEENQNNRGYISRPSDQRFKAAILFQDYIPDLPNFRMYLNLVYSTGLPGGSPSYADPYNFQNRLRDYRRADLGISHIFVDENNTYPKGHWLSGIENLNVGFEIYNLFNNQNSITNTWVRDVDSKQQFAVPNFMTSRVFNVILRMRF
ncbi:carboxypeptidase-like regulatory domain-containing protein [Flavobacteriaceae bacterium D16]|nr:carboxypeptidase-like regulatory domain-containing protein [Flavobacteriaceae bacterium D16]